MASAESVARHARRLRVQGEAEGWGSWRTVQEIHARVGVSLLAAHRLARDWTLRDAVEGLTELRSVTGKRQRGAVTVQMLNSWERGRVVPSLASFELLCRLYGTGMDRLGFGGGFDPDDTGSPAEPGAGPGAEPHAGSGFVIMDPEQVVRELRLGRSVPRRLLVAGVGMVRERGEAAWQRAVSEACQITATSLQFVPAPVMSSIMRTLGREVMTSVQPKYRNLDCVQEIRGLLVVP